MRSMDPYNRSNSREIQLDFLRGLAILMVVDFHSASKILFAPLRKLGFPPFGWVGVDVFFVLSGFLVGGLLMAEWKRDGRIDVKRFLIRRSFKIMPQYYVYLLIVVLSGHHSFRSMLGNFFHLQNYVGGIAHTWSLAVEEHAYLFLILLLSGAAVLRLRPRDLFILLTVLVVFIHGLRLLLACRGEAVYYTTHTRIDGILSGVLLAMIFHFAPQVFVRMQRLWWVWLLVLGGSLVFFRVNPSGIWAESVDFDAANWMSIALFMLIYRSGGRVRTGGQAWSGRSVGSFAGAAGAVYRFVAWMGVYSYGIYLWHVATLAPVARVGAYLRHSVGAFAGSAWEIAMPLVAAIAFGSVMTMLVEMPMLRLRERWFPRRERVRAEGARQGTREEANGDVARNGIAEAEPLAG